MEPLSAVSASGADRFAEIGAIAPALPSAPRHVSFSTRKVLNVAQRLRLQFFLACGLALEGLGLARLEWAGAMEPRLSKPPFPDINTEL